jgi:outer membrane lipoprotein SlyB
MKKVILALAIVSVSFAACNNAEKKEGETPTTDTAAKVETPAPATVDTAAKAATVDTAAKAAPVDTTKKK